jgi:hypothetical protein
MHCGLLGIRCCSCGRRKVVGLPELKGHRGDMRQLRDLTFRCKHCNNKGRAPSAFDLYIPGNTERAEAFALGEEFDPLEV